MCFPGILDLSEPCWCTFVKFGINMSIQARCFQSIYDLEELNAWRPLNRVSERTIKQAACLPLYSCPTSTTLFHTCTSNKNSRLTRLERVPPSDILKYADLSVGAGSKSSRRALNLALVFAVSVCLKWELGASPWSRSDSDVLKVKPASPAS